LLSIHILCFNSENTGPFGVLFTFYAPPQKTLDHLVSIHILCSTSENVFSEVEHKM
jgi:hypothetical protein